MSENTKTGEIAVLRSPLGRARGLGSAKSGAAHWMAERVTSVALVPLTLWFVWNVVRLAGAPHADMHAWAGHPLTTVLLLALVVTTFHHMQMGLQAVIDDYIHAEGVRLVSLLAMRGVCVLLGLAAVVAVLKLAL